MENRAAVNICFFGVNRSLTATIKSINQYIFDRLDQLSITYSVYGSFMKIDRFSNLRSNEFDQSPEQSESDLISFDGLKHVDQEAIDDLIRWDHVFRYGDSYGQIKSAEEYHEKNSTTKNIYRSLFCLKSSFALIPPDFRGRPTIFLRPDIEILSDIDLEFYLSLLCRKPKKYAFGETDGVAILPSWHCWDGLNDRFAMCSPGNATSTYANRFDQILSYLDISRHPIHPESYLLQILQAARVEILPIISTRMARIRANGVPQDEDFSKGSKILDLQSETLRSLNDLIKQRDSALTKLQDKLDNATDSMAAQKVQLEDSYEEKIGALSVQLESLKDEARESVVHLEKERNEARESVVHLEKERNEARESVMQLEKERDEARQVAVELNDDVVELKTQLGSECRSNEILRLQLKTLKADLEDAQASLSDLQEEAKVTLLSFHQVQQELEHYFQYSRKQAEMLDANADLQRRAAILLSRVDA